MPTVSYSQFLSRRGFPAMKPAGPFYRYMLVECWMAPGFDLFWRRWNPLAGYGLFLLYRFCGGARHHVLATLSVFLVAGALHDLLLFLVFGAAGVTLAAAWLFWGAACLLTGVASSRLRLRSWPAGFHAALNIALIVLGLAFGSAVQTWVLARAAA